MLNASRILGWKVSTTQTRYTCRTQLVHEQAGWRNSNLLAFTHWYTELVTIEIRGKIQEWPNISPRKTSNCTRNWWTIIGLSAPQKIRYARALICFSSDLLRLKVSLFCSLWVQPIASMKCNCYPCCSSPATVDPPHFLLCIRGLMNICLIPCRTLAHTSLILWMCGTWAAQACEAAAQ